MVKIRLMLKVLFTHDSEVEDLFCGASPSFEPSLFFSNYLFSLGFDPVLANFQHDCLGRLMRPVVLQFWQSCRLPFLGSGIISESMGSAILLFSSSHYRSLAKHHGFPAFLNKFCWYILQLQQTSPFSMQFRKDSYKVKMGSR